MFIVFILPTRIEPLLSRAMGGLPLPPGDVILVVLLLPYSHFHLVPIC